jgi:phosphoenolpyruvate-protein kinase (PTS system EI component)
LFDIAGDKRPPWFGNPPGLAGVLGLQGARLYNIEPMRSVLYAEFDALAALAPRYPLRVLIPYLTQLEELEYWRGEIAARISLPVGAMLETPAAALAVASWLKTADFAALGCNDLMQCLFASDRDQPELAHLLDPYCPTLYRFLRQVASEAGAASASLQVCGLLAQLPGVLPLLLGLGYRVFSVDPLVIPWLAQASREVSMVDCERKAEAACSARHSREVRALLGL